MPRPGLPPLPAHVVTARLPDGRSLIAHIDPNLPTHHSPLQRALTHAPAAPGEPPQTEP